MKERPILYSTPMVQALLSGTKTQTRRTKGLDFINESPDSWESATIASGKNDTILACFRGKINPLIVASAFKCPYGSIGDRLWVRETWAPKGITKNGERRAPAYIADGDDADAWRPSIHMRRESSRIILEISDIRIERLHSISADDAVAEGILEHAPWPEIPDEPRYQLYGILGEAQVELGGDPTTFDPIFSFLSLWHSINGGNSVERNPWVWALTFKRLS